MSDSATATPLAADYLDRLAAPTPTPGGGSASAVAAATGVALLEMVANLSLRSATEAESAILAELVARFRTAHDRLLALGSDDEHAYAGFRAALALPRTSGEEKTIRRTALEAAAIRAAHVPLDIAETALEQVKRLPALAAVSSPYIRADLAVAAHLLTGAIHGAIAMVDTNLPTIKDDAALTHLTTRRNAALESTQTELQTALASIA